MNEVRLLIFISIQPPTPLTLPADYYTLYCLLTILYLFNYCTLYCLLAKYTGSKISVFRMVNGSSSVMKMRRTARVVLPRPGLGKFIPGIKTDGAQLHTMADNAYES